MKLLVSSILVLGVVVSHTQGVALLGNVLSRPQTKYDSSQQGLDLESIDLDSLGDYEKEKPQQSNYKYNQDSSYDKKQSYDLGESLLNTGGVYDALPLKSLGSKYNKKSDLSEIFGTYNQLHNLNGNQLKDTLYSTTSGTKGLTGLLSPSYGLLENSPLYGGGGGQDYNYKDSLPSNLLYKLPTGQQLQCVVLN